MINQKKEPLLSVEVTDLTLKKTLRHENTDLVNVEITVPQVGATRPPATGQRMNEFYKLLADEKLKYAQTTLYKEAVKDHAFRAQSGYPAMPFEFSVSYTVTHNGGGFFSLFYDVFEMTGGAHGNTVRYADSWSLESGYPMPRLFSPGDHPDILRQITAQAEAREARDPGMFFPGIKANVRRHFDPGQSHLTPEGIVIFYQLYTIAPYVTGIVSFTVGEPQKATSRKA